MDNLNENDCVSFDKFLAVSSSRPEWVIVHPDIWNGYWRIKKLSPAIRYFGKLLGKILHIRWLLWLGMPLYWERGLKECFPQFEGEIRYIHE